MPDHTPTCNDILTTRVRFSADQLKPIFLGLDDLVKENSFMRTTGSLRRHPYMEDQHGRFNCHEWNTDAQMSAVLSAHGKVQPRVQTGGWIRLNHRELAACALAVSHASRLVRKKHAASWCGDYKAATRRVHKFIEKYRKRAIKQLPASLQKPEREKIVADLRAVRQRLAPNVKDKKQPRSIRMLAREVVSKGEKLAIAGLTMRGFEPPSNTASIRQKVRARLRNIARRGFNRRAVLEEEISAALTLADYVINQTPDLVRRSVPDEDGGPRARSTTVAPSKNALALTRKTETSLATVFRKEVPACLRIASSELEWLMGEDLDGESAWSKMSRAARIAAVAKAKKYAQSHLSNRHIGRIIGADDKTVARMLREAELPEGVRTEIARGYKSSNQALREVSDPVYQQSMRLGREKRDGSVSAAHAEQIVAYLGDLNPGAARQIVARAKELAARVPLIQLQRHVPDRNVNAIIAHSRKIEIIERDVLPIEIAALRLRWWLLRVAPERVIHNAALDKAAVALPNRAAYGTKS